VQPYIIGISGGSGSGKTSITKRLRATFSDKELCIICQDDYYLPIHEQQKDEQGIENFDLPNSINHQQLLQDLRDIRQGKTIEIERYNYNNTNTPKSKQVISPAPIILVEGILVFYFEPLRKEYDLKIFVHAKENLKIIRRIIRDQKERSYPIEDVLYRYQYHVMPTYERYIEPYLEDADIVINNNISFEKGFEVIKGFICNQLRQL
jgi:uridine kinase